MSSSVATAESAALSKPRSGLLSTLLLGLLSATVAAGLILGAGLWLLRSGKLVPPAAAGPAKGVSGTAAALPAEGVNRADLPPSKVVPLEPMVVNLSDAGGRAYLRASISLRLVEEAEGKADKAEGKADAATAGKTAALRDTTLSVLSAQTSEGLLATNGVAAAKKRLRERYALENPEVHVLDVYFTDFLVQRG